MSLVSMPAAGEFCAMAGTTRLQEAVVDLDARLANGFGNTRALDGAGRFVAGRVARENA